MSSFESRSQARRKVQLAAFALENRHSETESERILWSAIRGSALGVQFRRQVPIAGLFIGDFVASGIRLIIEVDGNRHANRGAADGRRDAKLQRLGFTACCGCRSRWSSASCPSRWSAFAKPSGRCRSSRRPHAPRRHSRAALGLV